MAEIKTEKVNDQLWKKLNQLENFNEEISLVKYQLRNNTAQVLLFY